MTSTIKHHSCALFEHNPNAIIDSGNVNCGVCVFYNNGLIEPASRSCIQHGKMIQWTKENYRSDWL